MTTDRGEKLLRSNVSDVESGTGDRELENVYRRISWRILPFCFIAVYLCYVDRTNLSLGANQFCKDIALSHEAYGTGVGLFFVTYMLFQIPSNLVLRKVGAPLWMGLIMMGWGFSASATAFVRTEAQFYAVRVLLGVFEAGTFPGLWYYISLFFSDRFMALPMSIMMSGIVLAMASSSPVAAGLLALDGAGGWRGWKWLFFLEGIPPIVVGLAMMVFLPKDVDHARFLTGREKVRVQKEVSRHVDGDQPKESLLVQIKSLMCNLPFWGLAVAIFCNLTVCYVVMFWTPLWITGMLTNGNLSVEHSSTCAASTESDTHKDVIVALITTIPYLFAGIFGVVLGWSSKRNRDQKYHVAVSYLAGAFCLAMFPYCVSVHPALAILVLTVAVIGIKGADGVYVAMVKSFLSPEQGAIGFAVFNSFTNFGGFVGPRFTGWLVEETRSYKSAVMACAVIFMVGGGLVLFLPNGSYRRKQIREEREEESEPIAL